MKRLELFDYSNGQEGNNHRMGKINLWDHQIIDEEMIRILLLCCGITNNFPDKIIYLLVIIEKKMGT